MAVKFSGRLMTGQGPYRKQFSNASSGNETNDSSEVALRFLESVPFFAICGVFAMILMLVSGLSILACINGLKRRKDSVAKADSTYSSFSM